MTPPNSHAPTQQAGISQSDQSRSRAASHSHFTPNRMTARSGKFDSDKQLSMTDELMQRAARFAASSVGMLVANLVYQSVMEAMRMKTNEEILDAWLKETKNKDEPVSRKNSLELMRRSQVELCDALVLECRHLQAKAKR